MNKAVLISIRPKWCELIASGKKTIEVRKTRPQIKTPFKCYMYMRAYHWAFSLLRQYEMDDLADRLMHETGKVIGEFVCDEIIEDRHGENALLFENKGWVPFDVQKKYAPKQILYGWHISALKVYDEPKELSEFTPCCEFMLDEKQCDYRKVKCLNQQDSFIEKDGCNCLNFVRRPPMSWCYVEELP